jgi:hypothetical protein
MHVIARTVAIAAVTVLVALKLGAMLRVPLPGPLAGGLLVAAVIGLFVIAVMVLGIHDRTGSRAPTQSRPTPTGIEAIRSGISGLLRSRRKIAICIVICLVVLGGVAWLIAWESDRECVRWHKQRVGWWGQERRVCAETAPRHDSNVAR